MFSGIVHMTGTVTGRQEMGGSIFLTVQPPKVLPGVKAGSSVAVDGVCLTVVAVKGREFRAEVIKETILKTTLGKTKVGDIVNLEPALRVGDSLDGHMVFGHIDTVGTVEKIVRRGDERLITVKLPTSLRRSVVPQGSVTLGGVALTVARITKGSITVALTKYTLEHTTLSTWQPGTRVNIESDMLGKYVIQIFKNSKL